ncbi:type VII secretion target [Nocardia sp. NPDC005978]|uniref:type VII secretion target n=1 Tax=unclassified Nocardia TaxID=2637762 RepID=UPI0033B65FCE
MTRFSIDPDGLTAYAHTAIGMAAHLSTAAARTAAADPLLLAPALGLAGADFLVAYRAAHATHLSTLTALTAVLTSMGAGATTATTSYAATDATYATALDATGRLEALP